MPMTVESRKRMGWRKNKIISAFYIECKVCGIQFKTTPSSSKKHCCSVECSSKFKTKNRIKYTCKICDTSIYALKRKSGGRVYCSTNCKIKGLAQEKIKKFENKRIFGTWKGYKEQKKWFIENIKMCQICGYRKEIGILEIHHIDRNRKNNKSDNLILLCPNCHSEEHYKKKDGQFKNNLGINMATKKQEKKVSKVLREFKKGKLKSFTGKKVTNRKQGLAIALSEAGISKKSKSKSKKK